MKALYTLSILFLFSIVGNAQQFPLYNQDGEGGAYIDYDKDAVLFSWGGEPVGFLQTENDVVRLFDFSGDVIGFYEKGLLYDKKGYVVAAKKGAVIHKEEQTEDTKGTQKTVPNKPTTTTSIASPPTFKNEWSEMSLAEFLLTGKK